MMWENILCMWFFSSHFWNQEFGDPRDADDARHYLDGRDFDGSRITVEFSRGVSCLALYFQGLSFFYMYGWMYLPNSWKSILCLYDRHLVVLGIMIAEAHLLELVAVLTVVLMVIGLETAQQGTGRTSVTVVVREDTLRETAKTAPRSLGTNISFRNAYFCYSFQFLISLCGLYGRRSGSYSRSPVRSRSPRRRRSPSRSLSRSRSYRLVYSLVIFSILVYV